MTEEVDFNLGDEIEFDGERSGGKGKKKALVLGGFVSLALALGGAYYFFTSGDKPAPNNGIVAQGNMDPMNTGMDNQIDPMNTGMDNVAVDSDLSGLGDLNEISDVDFPPIPAEDGVIEETVSALDSGEFTTELDGTISSINETTGDIVEITEGSAQKLADTTGQILSGAEEKTSDAMSELSEFADGEITDIKNMPEGIPVPDQMMSMDAGLEQMAMDPNQMMGGIPVENIDVVQDIPMEAIENITEPTDAEKALIANTDTLKEMAPPAESLEQAQTLGVIDGDAPIAPLGQGPNRSSTLNELEKPAVIRDLNPKYFVLKRSRGSNSVDARLSAARRALSEGRYATALEMFQDLRSDKPKDSRVLMGLAIAYQRSGDTASALKTYEKTLKRDPKNLDALTNMLGVLRKESPRFAADKLQQLRGSYPGNAGVAGQLGSAYGDLNEYGKAIKYLNIASSLDDKNVGYIFNRAVIYDRMGKKSSAAHLYREALNLYYAGDYKGVIPVKQIKKRLIAIQ